MVIYASEAKRFGVAGAAVGVAVIAALALATPLALFDAGTMPPARLLPGQRVRFRAIDAEAFRQWPRAAA